jgi:hypothetical protein
MNFKSLLSKLYEARDNKESFTRTGEATKKEAAKGKSVDSRSKDAARKRVERSREMPRDRKPKQELVKDVLGVKTKSGRVQLIFKDSFNKENHTKISKDNLSIADAQQLTKDPKFEQTRASTLLFGNVKQKEKSNKAPSKQKPKEDNKDKKPKSEDEDKKDSNKKEKEEEKPKAKRLSKEEIFQSLGQMTPEQLLAVPPDLRQEFFQSQRKPATNGDFDEMTYETLSVKFGLNPVSSTPYNQQVLNAVIFLAKMKMGASDQEMQTISAMNPKGMDFTRTAFYTAKKILSQLGEQCIQSMLTTIESGGNPLNSDGTPDMSCGDYKFKVSAGGEISLSTTEFDQSNKAFKGYITSALNSIIGNPEAVSSDKDLKALFDKGAEIGSGYSSELIPSEALNLILNDEKLLNKFKNTEIQDNNGNNIGTIIDSDGNLNPKASLDNYYKEWQTLSKQLVKGKNTLFKTNIINNILKKVLRGDEIADPKNAPTHLITVNGIFPMTDSWFDTVSKQSELEITPSKTILSSTNISSYKPSAAEMLKKYSVVVEEKESSPLSKLTVPIDQTNPSEFVMNHIINNYDFRLNASLLPGFKPKDLNSVEFNYLKIGKKTIKIPVEKGQNISGSMQEERGILINDILLEGFTNNFVLSTLVQTSLLTQAEASFFNMGEQILVENEIRPLELKKIYQNIMERIQNEPFRLEWALNILNDIEEEYKRDYKKEYRNYHGKKKQRKERAARTAARQLMIKKGKVKKGDGKDIDHKNALRNGGSNGINNLRVRNKSENRADNGHKKGESQDKDWK